MSPDLLVTILALLAVLLARHGLKIAARRSEVARRLRTLFGLIAALLTCRLASPVLGGAILTALTMIVAAWLPLAALRLVEELTRRHARRSIKLLALGGAVGFTVVALTVGFIWSAGAIVALAAFQSMTLLLMVLQLLAARKELSAADRRSAEAFLAALLLSVPLILTDFRALFPDLDVRGGAFAALLLVLASSTAKVEASALRRFLVDMGLILFAGTMAMVAAEVAGLTPTLALAGSIAGLAALLLITERFTRTRAASTGIAAALANAKADSRDALIAAHPMLSGGRVIGPADLGNYPAAAVAGLLRSPIVQVDHENAEVRALAREILLAHGATHLIRLAVEPPALLAISAGELATPALNDELALAARLLERMP